ncbi:hypothetical protein CC86DRAFT_402968 [Ophiobolus disseminans]|uniref:Mid2 domain-containing protein n=1 Tax=Ophiobolus disseminans TaxID=1469910 RepID=A0A6A7AA45_9PLEO|nr:hypothetical protein CC86DRAFT_402968 [Ophiobolus disseminans]
MTSSVAPEAMTVPITTTFSASYSLDSNLPLLSSRYVLPPECSDRWMLPNPGARPQDFTVWSANLGNDPLFVSCRPQSHIGKFSPGVCPEGNTLAQMLVVQWSSSGGLQQEWNAPCCPSGMGYTRFSCYSVFSTPFRAFAPLTLGISGRSDDTLYEYVTPSGVGSAQTSVTVRNTTTLSSALAFVDPVFIGWQAKDLSLFPLAYATSIAKQFNIPFTPTPTATPTPAPGLSSTLPSETSRTSLEASPPSSGLSTGAKAGIGVGAASGVALIAVIFAILFTRRRRRKRTAAMADSDTGHTTPEMADQTTRKWYLGGQWRHEAEVRDKPGELYSKADPGELYSQPDPRELDSKAVNVAPGPPVELDAAERGR